MMRTTVRHQLLAFTLKQELPLPGGEGEQNRETVFSQGRFANRPCGDAAGWDESAEEWRGFYQDSIPGIFK